MDSSQADEENRHEGRRNSRERRSSRSQTMFQRIQTIGEGFARKAASATELLADRELRRYITDSFLGAVAISFHDAIFSTPMTNSGIEPPLQEGADFDRQTSWGKDQ